MKHFLLSSLFAFGLFNSGSAQSQVTFFTNQGSFIVQLDDSIMPITAGNFKTLVDTKFYDGVIFHRIISNFMISSQFLKVFNSNFFEKILIKNINDPHFRNLEKNKPNYIEKLGKVIDDYNKNGDNHVKKIQNTLEPKITFLFF